MTNFLYYLAHVLISPFYLFLWCEIITAILEYKGNYLKIFLPLLY